MTIDRIDYVDDAHMSTLPNVFLEAPSSAASDWATAPPWFDEAGWVLPMGGFLMRTAGQTILVDAGLGPQGFGGGDSRIDVPVRLPHSGRLVDSLSGLGVHPEEVTDVVLTHLHTDHVGWIAPHGAPVFSHARHHCHRADLDRVLAGPSDEPAWAGVFDKVKAVSDLLQPMDGACVEIAESISLRLFAGHTPGNCIVEVGTTDGPVLLLGDTAHHPVLLVEDGWTDLADDDPTDAARSRDRLADELQRTGALGLGAHFPGGRGGRITRDAGGRRLWRAVAEPNGSPRQDAPRASNASSIDEGTMKQ